METVNTEKTMMQTELMELMQVYESRDENFNAIAVDGNFTNQLWGDLKNFFITRNWYTPDYMESLSDDEQDGVEDMLDGFDKLGEILNGDGKVMFEYNFLVTVDELTNAMGMLLNEESTLDGFVKQYPALTVKSITEEIGHVQVIEMQMKELVKNQK